jgi:hypothetical protein
MLHARSALNSFYDVSNPEQIMAFAPKFFAEVE